MDQRISAETQVKVTVADAALDAVVIGAGAAIDADWDLGTLFSA